jgi:hypothetical protein
VDRWELLHPVILEDLFAPEVPDALRPWADRTTTDPSSLTWPTVEWRTIGAVHLRQFMPSALMDAYCAAFEASGVGENGYGAGTPYLQVPELLDLCVHPPLMDVLEDLVGEPMAVHLNLTGWISTTRDWHCDCYLSPPEVDGWYAAVWVALEDIDPDSGPFQYVPGSHRWPPLSQERVITLGNLNRNDPDWPRHSEAILTPLYEAKINENGLRVATPAMKRGDVLVWHARLLHRGSVPKVPGTRRKAVISHYSALRRAKLDMPNVAQHPGGGHYFLF